MVVFSAGFGVAVYHLGRDAGVDPVRAFRYCAYNPGLILATAAFGYQDAFHTMIVTVAVLYALRGKGLPRNKCCTFQGNDLTLGVWTSKLSERSMKPWLRC